jgi:hypothetical protein
LLGIATSLQKAPRNERTHRPRDAAVDFLWSRSGKRFRPIAVRSAAIDLQDGVRAETSSQQPVHKNCGPSVCNHVDSRPTNGLHVHSRDLLKD